MFAMAIMLYFVYLRFVYPITTIEGAVAQSPKVTIPVAKVVPLQATSSESPKDMPPPPAGVTVPNDAIPASPDKSPVNP